MADYSLTASANWSAIKASLNDSDRIVPNGNWTLTLDENPTLTGIDFVATGTAATMATGAATTYTLANWIVRAGTTTGFTIASGKTVTGPITIFAGSATSSHGCVNSGTIGTATATGGGAVAHGVYNNAGALVTSLTATGGAFAAALGCFNLGTITTATTTGSATHAANGMKNAGSVGTLTATGGGVNNSWGCQNDTYVGVLTSVGGGTSGAHGCVNYGGVRTTNSTGTTSGAYGVNNYGVLILDVRNQVGDYAINRAFGTLILYGGTSLTGISGTAGDVFYIPEPANVVTAISVMGETGTYPTTETTLASVTVAFAGGAAAPVVGGRAYTIPAAASVVAPAVTSTALADGVIGGVDVTSDNTNRNMSRIGIGIR